METNVRGYLKVRVLAAAMAVAGLAGCNLSKQSAPDLTGPSTLGRSVILSASADRLSYDGASLAVVTATVRNANGNTEANVALTWEAEVVALNGLSETTTSVPVEPSPQTSSTGPNGTATTIVRAPRAPDTMPSGQLMLRVTATPVGDDGSQLAPGVDAKPRSVDIELIPLDGASAPNRLPVVDFTISPPVANINQTITFDGSLTRDEGAVCGDACTYTWDFGTDAATRFGRIVTASFPGSGTRTARLSVTDPRGATASKSTTFTITAPAAPVAQFVVIPTSPRVGQSAYFDSANSTVGAGATLTGWTWDFADGNIGSGQTINHTFAVAGTYSVTLTIRDDLGRLAQRTVSVTVVP
jgi:PKD repeat protein